MSETQLAAWENDAKALLQNQVFEHFVGKTERDGTKTNGELAKNLILHIAKNSQNWEEVKDLRMKLVGLEILREAVEEQLTSKDVETQDEIYDAV